MRIMNNSCLEKRHKLKLDFKEELNLKVSQAKAKVSKLQDHAVNLIKLLDYTDNNSTVMENIANEAGMDTPIIILLSGILDEINDLKCRIQRAVNDTEIKL